MAISRSQSVRHPLGIMRVAIPLSMAGLCIWALLTRSDLPNWTELGTLLADLEAWRWLAAALATAISFWALGRYDAVAHRHLRTGMKDSAARRAGMASIAFSQTVGFGLVTGAYARWRLMPGLSALQAGQITALVGLTFMTALGFLSGCALLLLGPSGWYSFTGLVLIAATLGAVATSFLKPELRFGPFKLRWPSFAAMAALTFWTFVDVAAAGTALWLLLPETTSVPLLQLLVVFAVALGAAILSSAPGGTGPLELTILAMLPSQDSAGLLAGILAFRLVYYAIPAVIAGALLLMPRKADQHRSSEEGGLLGQQRRPASGLPSKRPNAEAGIILQNGGHIQLFGLNQLALLDSPQIAVSLFDPISGHIEETFEPLRNYARQQNKLPCYYKLSTRKALKARKSGWAVMRIASEAVLRPDAFTEAGPRQRQLRRKLRQAEKAGIEVRPASATLPLAQMAALDSRWQDRHGGAHGTTMGRFEPGYLSQQEVFLAWKGERIVGFISLHRADEEWCLDLVRILPDAPDGTGHALIRFAIATAAKAGLARLSLAAVPEHRWAGRMDPGLRRFKSCFSPHWEPRYIAAPSWCELGLSLLELIRLVHRPGAMTPVENTLSSDMDPDNKDAEEASAEASQNLTYSSFADTYLRRFHNKVEDYAIARSRRS